LDTPPKCFTMKESASLLLALFLPTHTRITYGPSTFSIADSGKPYYLYVEKYRGCDLNITVQHYAQPQLEIHCHVYLLHI